MVDLHRRPDLRVVGFTTVMYEGPQPYQPNASCVLIKFNCGRCGKLMRDNEKQENIIMDPQEINFVMSEGPQTYQPHIPRTDSIENIY